MANVWRNDLDTRTDPRPQLPLLSFCLWFHTLFLPAAPSLSPATPLGSRELSTHDGWGQHLIRCLHCFKNIDFPGLGLCERQWGYLEQMGALLWTCSPFVCGGGILSWTACLESRGQLESRVNISQVCHSSESRVLTVLKIGLPRTTDNTHQAPRNVPPHSRHSRVNSYEIRCWTFFNDCLKISQ